MKRSVLLGLFVTASMMASTSFAAEDLCAVNLKTIENDKAQIQAPEIQERVAASVEKAKEYQAKGTQKGIEDCIAETNDTILDIKKATGGTNK